MNNKDEQLTYEELTALCRKHEEYIKELEEKFKAPIDTEKSELSKPSYEELSRQIDNLNVLIEENNALRWSLTTSHKEMCDWKNRSDMWQENYYKEHKRAEKLYDELNKDNKSGKMLVNKIQYKDFPEIELPKDISLPDEEVINPWHIYTAIVNEWKKDSEILKILKKHFQGQLDDNTPTGFDEFIFNGIDIYDIYEDGDYEGLKKIKEWLSND